LVEWSGKGWVIYSAAILIRLGLMVFGEIQDTYMAVKYTDIDYRVFSEAGTFVTQGQSPYLRSTYRYTPLL
jgi:phosphatidylinositol glycan class M